MVNIQMFGVKLFFLRNNMYMKEDWLVNRHGLDSVIKTICGIV
jgi:hypothetical protein